MCACGCGCKGLGADDVIGAPGYVPPILRGSGTVYAGPASDPATAPAAGYLPPILRGAGYVGPLSPAGEVAPAALGVTGLAGLALVAWLLLRR